MSLKQYRKKRNFALTKEPKGGTPSKSGRRFVVQKHAASHLHYDFRLELDGTLKSWAVPKGPSLDPSQKRLAVEVEDHPIEYGDFEGTIPAGEYGGGTVMVWDRGTWTDEGNADADYRAGRLKFSLDGEKLKGSWALVRTAQHGSRKPQWLLIKHRDEAAVPMAKSDILEKMPNSARPVALSMRSPQEPTRIGPANGPPQSPPENAGRPRRRRNPRLRKQPPPSHALRTVIPTRKKRRRHARRVSRGGWASNWQSSQARNAAQCPNRPKRSWPRWSPIPRRDRLAARNQVRRLPHALLHRQGKGPLL